MRLLIPATIFLLLLSGCDKNRDDGRKNPAPAAQTDASRETARELAAIAQKQFPAFKKSYESGICSAEELCAWSQRWMNAELEATTDMAAHLAVMDAYTKRADEIVALVLGARKWSEGYEFSHYAAKFHALQANPSADAAKDKQELAALTKEAYVVFKKASDKALISMETYCLWSRRWMEAEKDATKDDAARLSIKKEYVKRCDEMFEAAKINNAQANGGPGCDLASFYTAQFYALQAHRELERSQLTDDLLAVIKKGFEAYKIKFERGLTDAEDACVWSWRWLEADLGAAMTDAERQSSHEANANRADELVKLCKTKLDDGSGTAASLLTAQYYALHARRDLDAVKHPGASRSAKKQ